MTTAHARSQEMDDVLNPTYQPTTTQDTELFLERQKYMYAVFARTLQTDKGKSLVRTYQNSFDAQAIYKYLVIYSKSSTKATLDCASILEYLTSARLGDGKWKGNTQSFILHW